MKLHCLDESSSARHPARLEVSRVKWAVYYGSHRWSTYLRYWASTLPWWTHRLPWLGRFRYSWQYTREQFWGGALIPGVVLDPEEGTVAFLTNLSARPDTDEPVVRVIEDELGLIDGFEPEKGTRVLGVSTYSSTAESRAHGLWSGVRCVTLECLAEDEEKCRGLREEFDGTRWDQLEDALGRLPTELDPGLFRLAEHGGSPSD